MNHSPHDDRDDLLSSVANLLDSIGGDTGSLSDRSRFCKDASDWVRGVRHEMSQLLEDFQRGIQHTQAMQTTAEAANRIADQANSLAELAREAIKSHEFDTAPAEAVSPQPAEPEPAPAVEPESAEEHGSAPSHVERAETIRADVASFREQLRAERAERARKAAEERKRFVESLRRGAKPEAAPAPDASAETPEGPAPEAPAASVPTPNPPRETPTPSADSTDDPEAPGLPEQLAREPEPQPEPPRFRQQPIDMTTEPASSDSDAEPAEPAEANTSTDVSSAEAQPAMATFVVGSLTEAPFRTEPVTIAQAESAAPAMSIAQDAPASDAGPRFRRADASQPEPAAATEAQPDATPSSTPADAPQQADPAEYQSPFRRTDDQPGTESNQQVRFRMKPTG